MEDVRLGSKFVWGGPVFEDIDVRNKMHLHAITGTYYDCTRYNFRNDPFSMYIKFPEKLHSLLQVWTLQLTPLILYGRPHFWKHFFDNIAPKELRDKHKNKGMRESCFFMFKRVQNIIAWFFISNTIHQQAEIWSQIIYNLKYQKELKQK